MARRTVCVTNSKVRSETMPDWAAGYSLLVEILSASGVLDRIENKLVLERRPGYAGIDLFLFLLAFFTFPEHIGLRPFAQRTREEGPQLAALGNRDCWAGSSSISRALKSITMEQAQEFVRWLLIEAINLEPMTHHPEVNTRDTQGKCWHFFDYDPTVQVHRQRALPQGEDLPEAKRRSTEIAAPGYPGRKRGEVQYSRTPLQHSGSSLWLWQDLSPGNGQHVFELENAGAAVASFCAATNIELKRSVVRFDGGVGGVKALLACRRQGVRFLTRIARYDLLTLETVTRHLETVQWRPVEDSRSGPKREAAELGHFVLANKKDERQQLETRVVVSRFRTNHQTDHGAGTVIDGWHYELFAVDLPEDAWPAAQTVTAYYGRCGQENRFGQEDHELDLGRTFSFNPAGQLVATTIGLFLWNLRVCLGAQLLDGLPVGLEPPRLKDRDQRSPEPAEASEPPTDIAFNKTHEGTSPPVQPLPSKTATRHQVRQHLSNLDWPSLLKKRPGWQWDADQSLMRCPNGVGLSIYDVVGSSDKSVMLRFRANRSNCRLCPKRHECTKSLSHYFRKELSVTINREKYPLIANLVPHSAVAIAVRPHCPPQGEPRRAWRPPSPRSPGRFEVKWPGLIPSVLRHSFTTDCRATRVFLKVHRPNSEPRKPPWLAQTPAERQHRRQTWTQRLGSNALNPKARVRLKLEVPDSMARILSGKRNRKVSTDQK